MEDHHHQKFNGELQVEELSKIVVELRRTNNLLAVIISRVFSPADMEALKHITGQTEAILHHAEALAAHVHNPTKESNT